MGIVGVDNEKIKKHFFFSLYHYTMSSIDNTFASAMASSSDMPEQIKAINDIRSSTQSGLKGTEAFANEGSMYGGYNPATERIETSLSVPPAKSSGKKGGKAAKGKEPAALVPKSAVSSTSSSAKPKSAAANSKVAKAGGDKDKDKEARIASRRLRRMVAFFQARNLELPAYDASKPDEAFVILEEEYAFSVAAKHTDQKIIECARTVEIFANEARLAGAFEASLDGFGTDVERALESPLRDDVELLSIKYAVNFAFCVEMRLGWSLFNLGFRRYTFNKMGGTGQENVPDKDDYFLRT